MSSPAIEPYASYGRRAGTAELIGSRRIGSGQPITLGPSKRARANRSA
jgi:hypothetical protein